MIKKKIEKKNADINENRHSKIKMMTYNLRLKLRRVKKSLKKLNIGYQKLI